MMFGETIFEEKKTKTKKQPNKQKTQSKPKDSLSGWVLLKNDEIYLRLLALMLYQKAVLKLPFLLYLIKSQLFLRLYFAMPKWLDQKKAKLL